MKLEQLNLGDTRIKTIEKVEKVPAKKFWARQFQVQASGKQKVFDGVFGVVLPALCFLFDPVVFRGQRHVLLGTFKPFAYTLSFVSIMALLAFLLWGRRLKWLNGFLSGLFLVAAIVSFAVGVILLPFSLLGVLFLIGILGFTPLFTGFVFLRNAVRASRLAKLIAEKKLAFNLAMLGAVLSVTLPALINLKVESSLQTMKYGDAQTIRRTAQRLKYVAPIVNFDKLAGNFCRSENAEAQQAMAEAYEQLTGESIERKNYMICNDF